MAKNINKVALEYACKKIMMAAVTKSKVLREKLSFQEHVKVCEWITNLDYEQTILAFMGESTDLREQEGQVGSGKVRDFEGKFKTAAKYGMAGLAGGYGIKRFGPKAFGAIGRAGKTAKKLGVGPGAAKSIGKMGKAVSTKLSNNLGPGHAVKSIGAAMLALFLFRKLMDPCFRQCAGKFGKNGKVCKYTCQVNAAKQVLAQIRGQKGQCSHTSNPEKCLKKLSKLEGTWTGKLTTAMTQLNKAKASM
jgi:hypothetical protein